MDDLRPGDADGLTPAGMDRMLDWLHNVKVGQVADETDVIMCDLLAHEIESHRRELANAKDRGKRDATNYRLGIKI